jgi:hypothetical protein
MKDKYTNMSFQIFIKMIRLIIYLISLFWLRKSTDQFNYAIF